MSGCPTSERLRAYLADQLPEAETAAVDEHAAACPDCRARLARLADDPEVRAWVQGCAPVPVEPDPPPLQELIAKLQSPAEASPSALPSLTFLGPPQQPGDLGTFGPYRVLSLLGAGGMGIVLRAHDPVLGRTVALKVVRPECAGEVSRARFVRESQALGRVRHDHVVTVYDAEASGAGLPCLVMECVAGPSLQERIRQEKRLGPHEAAGIAAQVAAGLHAIHAAGLIHRDVKPGNVRLDPATGRYKIVDLGLARDPDAAVGLTRPGLTAGTPEYMSPEQVRTPTALTPACDVYSLGVTLYEMLTGEVPFRGTPEMVVKQALEDEPVSPRRRNDRIPRDLETICLKCLQKEPLRRYASTQELAEDLQHFLAGQPITARRVSHLERAWKWVRRRPATAVLLAVLALGVSGGLAASWSYDRRIRDAQAQLAVEAGQRQAAEAIAAARRYSALIGQARERMADARLGWTWEALRDIEEAARRTDDPQQHHELRNLAARCLAAVDLRKAATIAQGINPSCVAFSPDSRLLAVGEHLGLGECSVLVYDATTRRQLHRLSYPSHATEVKKTGIRALTFSPDSRWLIAGTRIGEIYCWDLARQPQARLLRLGHRKEVTRLAFHPTLGILVSCSSDQTVRFWEAATWKELGCRTLAGPLTDLAFSADGCLMALCGDRELLVQPGDTLELLRATADERRCLTTPSGGARLGFGQRDRVFAHGGDPLNLRLVVQDADSRFRSLDALEPANPKFAYTGNVKRLLFGADDALVVCASSSPTDRTVRLWDRSSGQVAVDFAVAGTSNLDVALNPDGRWLAVTADDQVELYEIRERTADTLLGLAGRPVQAADWAPDGRSLVCVAIHDMHDNHEFSRWESDGGRLLHRQGLKPPVPISWVVRPSLARSSKSQLQAVCLHPRDGIRIWGPMSADFQAVPNSVGAWLPCFAPDGRMLWAARTGGVVEAWSWPRLQVIARWQNTDTYPHKGSDGIRALAAGNRWVLVGTNDPATKLLRAPEAQKEREWPNPGGTVDSVALSPDESLAVSGTQQGLVQIVRVPDAAPVAELAAHQQSVQAMAFSPDGRLLGTGSRDRTVRLWRRDGDAFEELLMLRLPGPVIGLQFHPGGQRLAVLVQGERAVRVWHLERLRERVGQLGLGW
jgi:WD40 repeat protein